MRAAIYTSKGPAADVLRVVDKPDPEPAPGEVRLRDDEIRGLPPATADAGLLAAAAELDPATQLELEARKATRVW